MNPLVGSVRATRRALAVGAFLDALSPWAGWGMVGAGVVVLAGRLGSPAVVAVGAALALAVPLAGTARALLWRRRSTLVEAAIRLDRRGALGGLPLLLLAHPDSAWARNVDPLLAVRAREAVPRISTIFYARRLLPGMVFLFAAFQVPQQENPFLGTLPRRDSAARREVQRLAEEVRTLQEKKVLPDPEIERLRQAIKSLEAAAEKKAIGPEGWEGIDHLSEQMGRATQERSAQTGLAAAAAGRLVETLSSTEVDEAVKMEQVEALKRALSELPGLPMAEGLRQALDLGRQGGLEGLDSEMLKKSLEELKEFLDHQTHELAEPG